MSNKEPKQTVTSSLWRLTHSLLQLIELSAVIYLTWQIQLNFDRLDLSIACLVCVITLMISSCIPR